jgi:hypothetical protein
MKHYGAKVDISNRVSNFMSIEESKRLEKAKRWREQHLLYILLFYVSLPLIAFSILAFMIPYIYMFVPVDQSESCWNAFLIHPTLAKVGGVGMTLDSIPCALKLTNSIIFVLLNWGEVIGFALLFWLVRNIKNELNVKTEVQAVLLFWTVFSIIYFSL